MAQDFATFRLVAVHERPPDLGGLGRTMITSGWGKNVDEICGNNVAKKPVIHLFQGAEMSKNIWRNEHEWKAIDDGSVFIRVFSLGSGGGWSGDQSLIRKPIRTCHHGHDYLGTWHMCTPIREYLLNSHRHTVISQKHFATHCQYMSERIGVLHFRRLSIYFSKAPREWKASGAQANLFQFSAAASSCAKKGAWIAVLQIFDGCWPGIGVVVPASVYVLVTR